VRAEFLGRFLNSTIISLTSSGLAVVLGSLAAYGLSRFSYRFGYMRNSDISFFFLSQLILPPVVLALPFLVLYKELALLDTRVGLILLYTLTVLPIVIWIMRDQFAGIPTELEEAALVDGLSIWGAFATIVLPIALPGMAAAMTSLPVLGVPVQSKTLSGLDSLLSIVQMPKGIPVGTLAIGEAGAANAGLLAASIIALQDAGVAARLDAFRAAQTASVKEVPRPDLLERVHGAFS
jgi:phosphoribosylaminoimidazole carboxylase PurE protein